MNSDGNSKICDFGLSCKLNLDEEINENCGTDLFQSPEMIISTYNHSTDFWSLGICIFALLTGSFPFEIQKDLINKNEELENLYRSICYTALPNLNEKRKITDPDSQEISDVACDFVSKLLNKKPKVRLGSQTNPNCIKNHQFFSGFDWLSLENGKLQPPFKPDVKYFKFLLII